MASLPCPAPDGGRTPLPVDQRMAGDAPRRPSGVPNVRRPVLLLAGIAGQTWRDNAACKNHERPDIFFPPTLDRSSTEDERAQAALDAAEAAKVCGSCWVQVQCGDYAVRAGEKHGTWGGASSRAIRKANRRLLEVAA